MGKEIERKFLVNKGAWESSKKDQGLKCKQAYIVNDDSKSVRVRVIGEDAFITIKSGDPSIIRSEFEYRIPKEEAELIMLQFGGATIIKERFIIVCSKNTWEVDVFKGYHKGLIIAEIELSNENDKFELPDWVGEEVTGDHKYYNNYLAQMITD